MTRLPVIRPTDLRDHSDAERVERIWERLSRDLPVSAGPRIVDEPALRAVPIPSRRRTGRTIMLFAASLATFGLGIGLGVSLDMGIDRSASTTEPTRSLDGPMIDVFATGSTGRSFTLPGGARLSLDPDSTVEVVEVDGAGALTLRLVRGVAALETQSAPVSVVAGQAQVTAPAGSSVQLHRFETDVGVSVSKGSVEVMSPSGERKLVGHGDEVARFPIAMVDRPPTVARPDHDNVTASRDRSAPSSPHGAAAVAAIDPEDSSAQVPEPTAPAAPTIEWLEKFRSETSKAIPDVSEQELSTAISQAQRASDLMDLSALAAMQKRGDLAVRAVRRVADEFNDDPNRYAAALWLQDFYTKAGNHELALKYTELAKQGGFSGDIVVCRELRALAADDARHDAAFAKATAYLAKFPDGSCASDAKTIIDDGTSSSSASPDASASSKAKSDAEADKKKTDAEKKDDAAKPTKPNEEKPGDKPANERKNDAPKKPDSSAAPSAAPAPSNSPKVEQKPEQKQ